MVIISGACFCVLRRLPYGASNTGDPALAGHRHRRKAFCLLLFSKVGRITSRIKRRKAIGFEIKSNKV